MSLEENFTIIATSSLKEACRLYETKLPDIVFLDILLPDGNGINLLSRITNNDKEAYVIMLSEDPSMKLVMKCKELNAIGFLAKPVTKQKLNQHIDKFKKRHEALSIFSKAE